MTEKDLRLKYQSDTGYSIGMYGGKILCRYTDASDLKDYIQWLEEKLLTKINEV